MSTKRKKNSRNPAGILVKFIKIHDDSPWEDDYYMCGMCGHAISYKNAARHAKDIHKARRIELIQIETGSEDEEEMVLLPEGEPGASASA